MEPTFYLRRPRVQHHENSEERSGESPRSLKARDLGSPAVHQIEDQQCSPAPGDYFISDFAGLAALPFNSITITSIPLSLVFSGKWISPALGLGEVPGYLSRLGPEALQPGCQGRSRAFARRRQSHSADRHYRASTLGREQQLLA